MAGLMISLGGLAVLVSALMLAMPDPREGLDPALAAAMGSFGLATIVGGVTRQVARAHPLEQLLRRDPAGVIRAGYDLRYRWGSALQSLLVAPAGVGMAAGAGSFEPAPDIVRAVGIAVAVLGGVGVVGWSTSLVFPPEIILEPDALLWTISKPGRVRLADIAAIETFESARHRLLGIQLRSGADVSGVGRLRGGKLLGIDRARTRFDISISVEGLEVSVEALAPAIAERARRARSAERRPLSV